MRIVRLYKEPALTSGGHVRVFEKLQAALPKGLHTLGMRTEQCFYVEVDGGETNGSLLCFFPHYPMPTEKVTDLIALSRILKGML